MPDKIGELFADNWNENENYYDTTQYIDKEQWKENMIFNYTIEKELEEYNNKKESEQREFENNISDNNTISHVTYRIPGNKCSRYGEISFHHTPQLNFLTDVYLEIELPYETTSEEMHNWLIEKYKIDPLSILSVSVNDTQTIYQVNTLWSKEYTLELYSQFFHYMCDGFDTSKYEIEQNEDIAQCLESVKYDNQNILEWMH